MNGIPNFKSSGGWIDFGIGVGPFHVWNSNGKGGDRDARLAYETNGIAEDEEEKLM